MMKIQFLCEALGTELVATYPSKCKILLQTQTLTISTAAMDRQRDALGLIGVPTKGRVASQKKKETER